MAVSVSEQGSGVASALVAAAEERLAAHGCRRVQIEYTLKPCDPKGRTLHEWYWRLGFRPTAESLCILVGCCLCMSVANCQPQTFQIARKPLRAPEQGAILRT